MRQRIDLVGQYGLITDVIPSQAPPNSWTDSLNVRFHRGHASPTKGYGVHFTATGIAQYIVGFDWGGTWNIAYPTDVNGSGGAEEIYLYNGSTEKKVTRASANYTAAVSDWNGCVLNGVPVLNCYEVSPQYMTASASVFASLVWDLTTSASSTARSLTWDATDGTSKTYRAKVVRSFKNFLFALGVKDNGVEYPYLVHWSNPADAGTVPTSWDYADPTHDSGRVDLSDSSGFVLDGLALRDSFVIYKEDSIWLANFVGGQFIFQFHKLTDAYGLYAVDCAVDIGGRHVCVGDGVVYMHDGQTITNILEGRAADELFNNIAPDHYDRTFAAHNKMAREVWICYPSVGSKVADKALVYSYESGTWGKRSIPSMYFASPQIASGSTDSWPTAVAGGTWEDDTTKSWDGRSYSPIADTLMGCGSDLWKFEYQLCACGTPFPVSLERTGLKFWDGGKQVHLRAVYPIMEGEAVSIQVGAQERVDGTINWKAAQTFTPGTNAKIDCRVTGEAFAIRLSCENREQWTLSAYEIDFELVGER